MPKSSPDAISASPPISPRSSICPRPWPDQLSPHLAADPLSSRLRASPFSSNCHACRINSAFVSWLRPSTRTSGSVSARTVSALTSPLSSPAARRQRLGSNHGPHPHPALSLPGGRGFHLHPSPLRGEGRGSS